MTSTERQRQLLDILDAEHFRVGAAWDDTRQRMADRIEALYAEAIKCERAIAKAAAASPQRKT